MALEKISARGVLLDIEGTTSSIRYVYDVLFPFARKHAREFVAAHWGQPRLRRACELLAKDAGASSFAEWTADLPDAGRQEKTVAEALRLMDADAKATGLKELQGLIWEEGYSAGELHSHIYDDVPPALRRWKEQGRDIRIYSSGSIAAQQVFFRHTTAGDLNYFLKGNYDTTTGPKREASSYARIAEDMKLDPAQIVFLSDVGAELQAARAAGLQAVLALRPGNPPQPAGLGCPAIESFDALF